MDHRVPRIGAAISVVLALLAIATFIFLNQKFEGPSVISAIEPSAYELTATFKDTEILPSKQPVLHKGVAVGKVTAVDFNKDDATGTVHFEISDEFAPVYADASVQIGERSILGDPYLNLDTGTEKAGELGSGSEIKAMPSVDFDEALSFLDERGRRHVRSIVDTFSTGAQRNGNGERLNGTVGGLTRTIDQLHTLTGTLQGQERDLAGLVSDSATVLSTLGDRERSIRDIIASGRITLDALATNTASVEQAVTELPRLLDSGRRALAEAEPLLVEARPLVADLRVLAPDLTPALRDVGPLSNDIADIIEALEPQRVEAVPVLRKTLRVTELSQPVIEGLDPASRNLVPILDYLAPRSNSIAAFFSNAVSVTAPQDSVGRFARFGFIFEPGQLNDSPTPAVCSPEDDVPANQGFCQNAYPAPNDALDNEPFVPGSFPRLMPFEPPPP